MPYNFATHCIPMPFSCVFVIFSWLSQTIEGGKREALAIAPLTHLRDLHGMVVNPVNVDTFAVLVNNLADSRVSPCMRFAYLFLFQKKICIYKR